MVDKSSKPKFSHRRYAAWLAALVAAAGILIAMAAREERTSSYVSPLQPTPAPPPRTELDIRGLRERVYRSAPLMQSEDLGTRNGAAFSVVAFGSDARPEYALQSLPVTPAPLGGYPTIVLCHGYIPPKNYSTTGPEYRIDMEALSRHGYAVIKPDYRGHGRTPGIAAGAYYSDDYVIDVLTLIDGIKNTSYLSGRTLGILGHSLGGYVALKTALASPNINATVVIAGAVGSTKDLYEWLPYSMRDNPRAISLRDNLVARYGIPSADSDFWMNASLPDQAQYVSGPVQLHVGALDREVSPDYSLQLHNRFVKNGLSSEYYVYPSGGHRLGAERKLIWPRMFALFDERVGIYDPATLPVPIPLPDNPRRSAN